MFCERVYTPIFHVVRLVFKSQRSQPQKNVNQKSRGGANDLQLDNCLTRGKNEMAENLILNEIMWDIIQDTYSCVTHDSNQLFGGEKGKNEHLFKQIYSEWPNRLQTCNTSP